MGVIGRVREAGRWIGTVRRARGRGATPQALDAPGAPPRAAVRRPDEDPALEARLDRWRAPGPAPEAPAQAMGARERTAAMADLEALRARLDGEPAAMIDAALAAGQVTVRSLGPEDGHVWVLPGMRVFAIAGVQAFTVDDRGGS